MSTAKSEPKGATSTDSAQRRVFREVYDTDHERILSERNRLQVEVAQKVEEIENVTSEILSACENLRKVFNRQQENPVVHTSYEQKTPPATPNPVVETTRSFGRSVNVFKRSATVVAHGEHSKKSRQNNNSNSVPRKYNSSRL